MTRRYRIERQLGGGAQYKLTPTRRTGFQARPKYAVVKKNGWPIGWPRHCGRPGKADRRETERSR